MNRRDALKFGLAAPLAAPAVVKATVDAVSAPRFGRMASHTLFIDGKQIDSVLAPRIAYAQKIVDQATQARTLLNRTRELSGRLSVEAQMLEHDLFEPSSFDRRVA